MIGTTHSEKPHYVGHRQRLRDRFLAGGGKDMPDYELLELLLTIAIPRRDVKPLAKELIKKFKDFVGVLNASPERLSEIEGVKETTIAVLKIVKEAALRMSWQNLKNSDEPVISNWDAMVDYCRSTMAYNTIEEFRILFVDKKYHLIGEEVQQRGTVDCVSIHPREVIRSALEKGAKGIILVHNHPSGDVTPSQADIAITRKIKEAGETVEIKLLDHFIVSKYGEFSFLAKGIL